MNKSLTRRQAEAFAFIKEYIEREKVAPALKEIGAHLNVTVGTAFSFVKSLEKRRVIRTVPHRFRSIEIVLSDENELLKIRKIIGAYYHALDTRQDGVQAQIRAFGEIQEVLGMQWVRNSPDNKPMGAVNG